MIRVFKKGIVAVFMFSIILATTGTSYAMNEEEDMNVSTLGAPYSDSVVKINEVDFPNKLSAAQQITKSLNNTEVTGVMVIHDGETAQTQSLSVVPAGGLPGPIYYTVENVKSAADYRGQTIIAKAIAEPGITASIGVRKEISRTYSGTFGTTISKVSAALGYSVTSTDGVTISGSAVCPSTYNDKKVKYMTLNANVIYKVKTYDVYKHGLSYWKTGTGNSKRAYGDYFYKTYTYL